MSKIIYYDITNLKAKNCAYNMLLGQRSNGKSYQVKKNAIEESYKEGKLFIYLRRWQADIKQKYVNRYFADMNISDITNGEYDGLAAYAGDIYFTKTDEKTGKPILDRLAGSYCCLNDYERYKSQAWPNYRNIIYEEFITDAIYLDDEPKLLMQFCSTVVRNNSGRVWLIGNTLSRVCPYFEEWCLDKVLTQAIGTIDIYHFHAFNEDGTESIINMAVEYCQNAKGTTNTMFFGRSAKQIVGGEWDTYDAPKLKGSQDDYNMVYEALVKYGSFSFCMQLMILRAGVGRCVFVYPFKGKRKAPSRVITNEFTPELNTSTRLDPQRRPEALMIECFKLGKVCYSDNLTAADFKHVLAELPLM